MTNARSLFQLNGITSSEQGSEVARSAKQEREQQLADIAACGDEDNAECAAADLAREFPATR